MGQNMGQRVRRKGQHWLDALSIGRETRPGMHADCGGLYLLVSESGGKSWIFRYRQAGRLRDMGLGSQATIGLAEARRRARKCREQRLDGLDPLEVRKAERQRQRLEAAKAKTFAECAEAYIADHKAGWKNPKHAKQWPATLAAYVYPAFGSLPVQVIDTALVMKAIQPIWTKTPETASRVRGRIESVLDWATACGYRKGENPARWRGHLDKLLAAPRLRRSELNAERRAAKSTMRRCLMPSCRLLWLSYISRKGLPLAHWNSQSSRPLAPMK